MTQVLDSETTDRWWIELSASSVARARAEAAEVVAMRNVRESQEWRIASIESPMVRLVERAAVIAEIAQAVGRTDAQVQTMLYRADQVMAGAPRMWEAFEAGEVDWARTAQVAMALAKLERHESRVYLDERVVAYASTHTVDETRDWLRRLVKRLEADLATERAEAEREKRRVVVEDGEDGMSWVSAYLPSHLAAALYERLRRRARALRAAGDERTIDQIMADLLADAVIPDDAAGDGSGLRIDIGVLLTADALTGADDSFAEAADGTWEVPTDWILQAAANGDTFWHRMLRDPLSGNVLEHEYAGYSPPDLLRRALVLRDGTCATPGCLRPAVECDLDHLVPWPHGPTQGTNLRHRCRRHHALKSHGCLGLPDRNPRDEAA